MQRGYIALLTILIVMAAVLTIASTVAFLSIGEAQSGLSLFKGEQTLDFVEGCTEDAMIRARNDSAYNGGDIIRPEGTCNVTINSKVANRWTMTTTTPNALYKRTIQLVFDRLSTGISLISWKEI